MVDETGIKRDFITLVKNAEKWKAQHNNSSFYLASIENTIVDAGLEVLKYARIIDEERDLLNQRAKTGEHLLTCLVNARIHMKQNPQHFLNVIDEVCREAARKIPSLSWFAGGKSNND